MLQAFRLQQGNPAASYQQMKAALGEPKSTVSLDRAEGIVFRRLVASQRCRHWRQGCCRAERDIPGDSAWAPRRREKASNAFTEYDGLVHEAGEQLDPCADGASSSITELGSAARCPFRFFLKRGLGVRPLEERERDKDVWLDSLMCGSNCTTCMRSCCVGAATKGAGQIEERRCLAAIARRGAPQRTRARNASCNRGDPGEGIQGIPGRCRTLRRRRI